MAWLDVNTPERRIVVFEEYIQLWQELFHYISDDLTDKTFTEDDEHKFAALVQKLASKHYQFIQLAKDHFNGGDEVLSILTQVVSLAYLRSLPEATFSKLQVDWHKQFLNMNKCLGKYLGELLPSQLEKIRKKLKDHPPHWQISKAS